MTAAALPRKQTSAQDDWLRTLERLRRFGPPDAAHLGSLVAQTVAAIAAQARGKRAAFAWSGGKDSLALEHVCYAAGVRPCVLVISNLEYPAFLAWATDRMPPECEVVDTGQDLDWLAAHPDLLFPRDATAAGRWFKAVQHTGQEAYYRTHRLDLLLLGRRRADGNYVGPAGTDVYANSRGLVRYSPLAGWTHEDVLAYLVSMNLDRHLPPCYFWPRGFRVGTGPWPARQYCPSREDGWREVYSIDPAIVRRAAPALASARAFLRTV